MVAMMDGHLTKRDDGQILVGGTRLKLPILLGIYQNEAGDIDAVLEAFPFITKGDIYAALAYAADHGIKPEQHEPLKNHFTREELQARAKGCVLLPIPTLMAE